MIKVIFATLAMILPCIIFPRGVAGLDGIVLDNETRKPIHDAVVVLYVCTEKIGVQDLFRVKTDIDGSFHFTTEPGRYFLFVVHPQYEVYGPLESLEGYIPNEIKRILSDGMDRTSHTTIDFLQEKKIDDTYKFNLADGEVKQCRIELNLGAQVTIHVERKFPGGIVEKIDGDVAFTICDLNGMVMFRNRPINKYSGAHTFRCLKAVDGYLIMTERGYIGHRMKISLQKGNCNPLNYTMDYSNGQVIHGYIDGNSGGCVTITLCKKESDSNCYFEIANTESNTESEFWFGGMAPGLYILQIDEKEKTEVLVRENEMVEVRLNINPRRAVPMFNHGENPKPSMK